MQDGPQYSDELRAVSEISQDTRSSDCQDSKLKIELNVRGQGHFADKKCLWSQENTRILLEAAAVGDTQALLTSIEISHMSGKAVS